MRGSTLTFLALVLVAPAFAGCINSPDTAGAADAQKTTDLLLAAPVLDAAETLASIKQYSEAFPMRRGDNDAHNGARAFLLKGFQDLGLEAFMDEFTAPISPTSTPTSLVTGSERLVNVVGIKWGVESPEEWIVIGAHYDVTDGAVYGAYDDGSGTMIVQKMAAAFKNIPTARTLVFINFDGEEQGLRGSRHFVEAYTNGDWMHNNGTVVGMVDFDMAGIMYPADPPLVADVVSAEMEAIIEAKRIALAIPDGMVQYRGISGGSSDNGPFKAVEIPSVLFISDFDDVRYQGQELPGNYPFWHQLDTYENMETMAGGPANLAAGMQHVLDIGSTLIYEMAGTMALTFKART